MAREFSQVKDEIFPTRAAYLYYDVGDYTFFHHDNPNAHITIILGLAGDLLPLVAYPNFGPASTLDVTILNQIENLDKEDLSQQMILNFGDRSVSSSINIDEQYAVAIRGRKIPHARPRQDASCTVCTACYAFLTPSQDWVV